LSQHAARLSDPPSSCVSVTSDGGDFLANVPVPATVHEVEASKRGPHRVPSSCVDARDFGHGHGHVYGDTPASQQEEPIEQPLAEPRRGRYRAFGWMRVCANSSDFARRRARLRARSSATSAFGHQAHPCAGPRRPARRPASLGPARAWRRARGGAASAHAPRRRHHRVSPIGVVR
jgi:hypothetical protein